MIKQFQKEYRWLSNFAPVEIIEGPFKFRSVEHAYMAAKSSDPNWKEFCQETERPGVVKKASYHEKLIPYWHDLKTSKMKSFLKQKFNQEPYKTKLIQTGTQKIQEGNYWNDTFWGVCLKTNKGSNILGKLIMEIREEIKRK